MKLTSSLAAKITAIFIISITVLLTVAGTFGIVFSATSGIYDADDPDFFTSDRCRNLTYNNAYYALNAYSNNLKYGTDYLQNDSSQTNFFFKILDKDGNTVFSNYIEQEYGYAHSYSMNLDGKLYTVEAFVKNPVTAADEYLWAFRIFDFLAAFRFQVIIVTAVAGILSIALFIFLICSAGHRKGARQAQLNLSDKMPYDLYILLVGGLFALSIAGFVDRLHSLSFGSFVVATLPVSLLALWTLLALCMTTATRVKVGGLWKNTVVYRVCHRVWSFLKSVFENLPFIWKTVLAVGVVSLIDLILMVFQANAYYSGDSPMVFWFFWRALVIAVILVASIQLNKLKQGGKKLAEGDLNFQIDSKHMLSDFKEHAQNLNGIGDGMAKAVEQKMKSELFKTELITNVSHDIKTPLTSIINYVDLLKKEGLAQGHANEYIEVIDRQSLRLKKLTEDIVEMSKVSTGNIQVNAAPTNVGELLSQAVGEYSERLAQSGLEPVVTLPDSEAMISADGRLLWRVFDNVLNNICKYSMPNTRVYFNITMGENKVLISSKNISKYPLNISGDELMERFVRGDVSRNTEGSGLGLSIAKSLTELQQGRLKIVIDGDLFKIELLFDRLA